MTVKIITKNRKAYHEYHVLEKIEAGIVLVGSEVKSLREGKISLAESYARIEDGGVKLFQANIPHYKNATYNNHETTRTRVLLLHRDEIKKLKIKTEVKGMTIIPLSMYFKDGKVKVELGLCKGKQLHDKRQALRAKQDKREAERIMKGKR